MTHAQFQHTGEPSPLQRLARVATAGLVLLYLYSALIPFEFDAAGLTWEALRERVRWVPYWEAGDPAVGVRFSLWRIRQSLMFLCVVEIATAVGLLIGWPKM